MGILNSGQNQAKVRLLVLGCSIPAQDHAQRQCCGSNNIDLDPDPEFWPNLDPDRRPDPDPELCYQF